MLSWVSNPSLNETLRRTGQVDSEVGQQQAAASERLDKSAARVIDKCSATNTTCSNIRQITHRLIINHRNNTLCYSS